MQDRRCAATYFFRDREQRMAVQRQFDIRVEHGLDRAEQNRDARLVIEPTGEEFGAVVP